MVILGTDDCAESTVVTLPVRGSADTLELIKEQRNCFLGVWLLIKGEFTEAEAVSASYFSVLAFLC